MAVLGLCCCAGFFSSCGKQGLLSGCGLWISVCRSFCCCGAQALGTRASLPEAHGLSNVAPRLQNTGLIVVVHGLSCSIFPTQGSNPHLLHWQVDSLPLSHQRSPVICFYFLFGSRETVQFSSS